MRVKICSVVTPVTIDKSVVEVVSKSLVDPDLDPFTFPPDLREPTRVSPTRRLRRGDATLIKAVAS